MIPVLTDHTAEVERENARLRARVATLLTALVTIKSESKDPVVRDYADMIYRRYAEE